jgi:phage major head subunit gpT-like protein
VFKRAEFEFGVDMRANAGFGFPQMAFMSTAPLTGPYYSALRQAMTSQVSDTGRRLNIKPNIIVVGPSNRAAAKELFQTIIAAATTNIYLNDVEIVETAYLP